MRCPSSEAGVAEGVELESLKFYVFSVGLFLKNVRGLGNRVGVLFFQAGWLYMPTFRGGGKNPPALRRLAKPHFQDRCHPWRHGDAASCIIRLAVLNLDRSIPNVFSAQSETLLRT